MISLATEIKLPEIGKKLTYHSNSLLIGSCFTENIGNHLQEMLFPSLLNPCGILFNPASIAQCLSALLNVTKIESTDLFFSNDLWHHYQFHSKFSRPVKEEALFLMNESVEKASVHLKSASHLFLTFGTAYVYREKARGEIVGNCHKMPSVNFERSRLSVEEMSQIWIPLLERIIDLYPNLHVVFTISPIRHLSDGSYENQLSKSSLFLLTDQLLTHFGKEKASYFPSYELVMDELRDYRFYASDMIHLSETAIKIIQEKFNDTFLDQKSKEIADSIEKINSALAHKPFQAESVLYQNHLTRLLEETDKIANKYPHVKLDRLINVIIQKKHR